ncbi:MAG TPA: AbrB/MazE/SpoVT family DNA-binding domain-containing protein [Chondromyces sp.]|nr:AbrB/MazE/SpoVT family DNA-binding domain-containing protein [Chondromyces sp.]
MFHIQMCGKSLVYRIPKDVAIRMGLDEGSNLGLTIHDDRVVIKPRLGRVT